MSFKKVFFLTFQKITYFFDLFDFLLSKNYFERKTITMTTHTRTRNALAEIPARMGLLRVSTPDLTRNMYINDHVVMHNPNISLELNETSATSPDEFIIRQRG